MYIHTYDRDTIKLRESRKASITKLWVETPRSGQGNDLGYGNSIEDDVYMYVVCALKLVIRSQVLRVISDLRMQFRD